MWYNPSKPYLTPVGIWQVKGSDGNLAAAAELKEMSLHSSFGKVGMQDGPIAVVINGVITLVTHL